MLLVIYNEGEGIWTALMERTGGDESSGIRALRLITKGRCGRLVRCACTSTEEVGDLPFGGHSGSCRQLPQYVHTPTAVVHRRCMSSAFVS